MRPARLCLFLVIVATIFVVPLAPPQQVRAYQHWSEIKLWASYWTTERGFTSTLEMKNNRIKDTLVARVSIYFINGEEYTLDSMSIAPRQTVVLNLNQIIEGLPRALRARLPREGTVEVEYEGPNSSALMGSVSVTNPDQGIAWSFFLYPGYRGLSNAPLQGLFWFPTRKTDGVVILHNTSETGMTVRPRIQIDGVNHLLPAVTLRGDEVAKLDLRRALRGLRPEGAAAGGIELTYEGEPDALRAHGLLFDGEGFSTQVDFYRAFALTEPEEITYHAPRFAAGVADPVLGLPRRTKFDPFVVLHNFSESQFHGEMSISYRNNSGPQEMKIPLDLEPGQTRAIELESYMAGRVPRDAHWAGMEIRYRAKQGALAMTMVSLSEDRKHSIRSVLNWVQATAREGWYWNVDSDNNTLVGIQNSATEEALVAFSLDYYLGESRHSYELPLRIPARSSHFVDVGEIIANGLPDRNGAVIPASVTFGGYRAVRIEPREGRPLTTEALRIDRRRGTFLAVYNTGCCEVARFLPSVLSGPVGLGGSLQIELEDSCTGAITDATWIGTYTTGNASVATVDSQGNVSYEGAGGTTVTSRIWHFKPKTFNQEGQPITCHWSFSNGLCAVSVTPIVSAITPPRKLIGTTANVVIQGNGFASGATVNAGTGISVTVNSTSQTEIQASFNISASAPAGNHNVSVTVSGKQSNIVTFFVQVPHHLKVLSDISGSLSSCPTTVAREIGYQTVDINNNPVGTSVTKEQFGSKSSNTCGNPVDTSEVCSEDAFGTFFDTLTVGCNSVGGSCGFTFTAQQWLWCPYGGGSAIVIASPGTIVVQNNSISVGGNTTGFTPGSHIFP